MRAWLALEQAGAEYRLHDVGMKVEEDWKERILQFSGAGKVPILVDGTLSVHESLAICEYVAEKYPEACLWPEDMRLRARGRAISCEMLSSFQLIRSHMPCNLRGRAARPPAARGLEEELSRVFDIWEASLSSSGGPFLLGRFSIADCMYMPVAARFRTYGVPLTESAARYSRALFEHPAVRKLEELAAREPAIPEYDAVLRRES